MTLHLNAEQEEVIGRAIQAGLISTASEALEVGVQAIRQHLADPAHNGLAKAENLADLFASSPFAGLNLDFERVPDEGREVKL